MADDIIRTLERNYSITGSLEDLDALDLALRRHLGETHPAADDLRLELGTKLALAAGSIFCTRATARPARGIVNKPMLAFQQLLYLSASLALLERKSQGAKAAGVSCPDCLVELGATNRAEIPPDPSPEPQ